MEEREEMEQLVRDWCRVRGRVPLPRPPLPSPRLQPLTSPVSVGLGVEVGLRKSEVAEQEGKSKGGGGGGGGGGEEKKRQSFRGEWELLARLMREGREDKQEEESEGECRQCECQSGRRGAGGDVDEAEYPAADGSKVLNEVGFRPELHAEEYRLHLRRMGATPASTPSKKGKKQEKEEKEGEREEGRKGEEQEEDHVRHTLSVSNPCKLMGLNLGTSPRHAFETRANIATDLLSEGVFPRSDFEAEELTAEKLQRVFVLADKYVYQSTLLPAIVRKGVVVDFQTAFIPANKAGLAPTAKTIAFTTRDSEPPSRLIFQFNVNRFGDSAHWRVTNGVATTHKLDALIVTVLHELVHAILYVWCRDQQGHGAPFSKLNSKLNGHRRGSFQFRDLVGDERELLRQVRLSRPQQLPDLDL